MVVRLDLVKPGGVGNGLSGRSVTMLKKNTQHPSVMVPRELADFTSWWIINKVITLIERTVPFKSLFTCQIIKSANRESVPDQIRELLMSQWILWRDSGGC